MDMDKTIIKRRRVFRETRFRQPGEMEKACGLWVDRIGSARVRGIPADYRVLGQFAAVGVESGSGVLQIAGQGEWRVKAGDVMLIDPEEPSRYFPDEEWMTRWVVWNGPEAEGLIRHGFLDREARVVQAAEPELRRTFFTLAKIMDREDRLAVLERKVAILQWVTDLARVHQEEFVEETGHRRGMEWIVDYIQRSPAENLDVRTLANLSRLSEPQFRRVFQQFTSRAPLEFITAQRMSQAKTLLSRGMPIKQVAAAVGYLDPCYFMRVFHRVTGETAGSFVRNHLQSL